MISTKELINQKYGRFIIIKEAEPYISPHGQKERKVLCQCNCGKYKKVRLTHLLNGKSQSCGCLSREKSTKHKLCFHPLYKVWVGIKDRCYNSNYKQYKDYGKRGIKVYSEWINNPETFIKWALINGWKKDLLIDRENNDGNYMPNNVRFVDRGLSNRNQRLLRSNNTSGYRGVSWNKQIKKWIAQIRINNKNKHLGCFDRSKLAALRYDAEAFLLNDGRPLNFGNYYVEKNAGFGS